MNGTDLSRASHEEAVEALRSAKDPIVVQVAAAAPGSRVSAGGCVHADGDHLRAHHGFG